MATTKEQLINALRRLATNRDDSEAWEILFTASWATALTAAHRVLRGELDLAQDVAQEAFRRVVRYCDFLEIRDADAFLAYLAAGCQKRLVLERGKATYQNAFRDPVLADFLWRLDSFAGFGGL